MSYIDIILIIPLLWGTYKGFTKGFIIQISTLAALMLGIYGGIKFSESVSVYLQLYIEVNYRVLMLISFALTFLLIVIAIHFLARVLKKFISLIALGFVNKLFGAIFGLLKTAFILSVVLVLINMADETLKFIPLEEKSKSVLYEPVSRLVPAVIPGVREWVN
ncbi:CvpA family protein [bacterium AH-315-M05]|nr:CvpA family protein [bacterium AH-315-M05]